MSSREGKHGGVQMTALYAGSILFMAAAVIWGLLSGSAELSVGEIVGILLKNITGYEGFFDGQKNIEMIIWNIRLPRILLALLVGSALALAGAAFQGLLQNPLADPYTIGVSSGASVGAVIVLFFQVEIAFLGSYTLPLVAIMFSFASLFLVFGITKAASRTYANETIILSGIILNSFIGSVISLIIALSSGDQMREVLNWLMGSVALKNWGHIGLFFPFFAVGSAVILFHYRELNALALGDEAAQYGGMNVRRKKLTLLISAGLLTGAAVSVSGAIGFVGLVIPHLVRLVTGADHKHLIPLSMMIGGGYLVLADMVARTIVSPQELPIGVITALIGAPVFTYLLIRERIKRRKMAC
ncbi:FecCD family ABC transporter permease [Bacillus sp. FJAT-27916]|uniref:FecCD family ABC transporter permease n=1 Tax=Bacillus sp. FJAT-27916 TaxID=1679169 RepID=UPI001E472E03|nr:iron ABC transporter permease [Bacillus sp. FJAT-27916]